MTGIATVGFVGLGVMGGPMCRNLKAGCGQRVVAFDQSQERLSEAAAAGIEAMPTLDALVDTADLILLCLPGEPQVRAVCDGILPRIRPGQTVVDMSTVPPALEREMAAAFRAKGADYADAPIARSQQAAVDGTLSIMVGGSAEILARVEPYLRCMGTDVTLCGDIGTGQVVKLMNNMVLFEIVGAIAEALAIGRRAGVDGALLFDNMAKGSADSFALRNHGIKFMAKDHFPERAFPCPYALKDVSYALALAEEVGIDAKGGKLAAARLEEAIAAGYGPQYNPVVYKVIDKG
ncbi:MAG: NAD(P)-dependent oxidoreductase [Alphaproteobacteria bacterium]